MKTLILFLLLAAPLFSQVGLENWGCDTIISVSNTNPAVLTCNTAHGFDSSHTSWQVKIFGATGSWTPINTRWNTNAVGSIQLADTVISVVDAVPATIGDTIQLGFCNDAAYCGTEGTVTITAKDTTSNPHTITVTRSAPAFHYASAMYCGACGSSDPSIVYGLARSNTFTATWVSSTQFSIPVNATSFGALTGTVRARRTNGAGVPYGTDYTGANANVGTNSFVSGGTFTETLPAIPDPTNRKQVMMSVIGTSGFTNVSRAALGNQIVCATQVCTINLASPYPSPSSDLDRRLVVGSLVFLDGFADKRVEDGWLVTSVNADQPTSFTISMPGIPDGTYVGRAAGVAAFNVAQRSTLNPDLQVQDSSQQWSFPGGYMQGYVKSGTWDTNTNRFYTWVKMSLDMQRRANGGYEGIWGNYSRIRNTNSNGGQYNEHPYFYWDNNWYADQWVQVVLNAHPTHQVGGGTWEMGNEPFLAKGYIGNPGFLGDGSHLYDQMGRMFFAPAAKTVPNFVGVSATLAPITLGTVANEPDSSVSTIHALWSSARYTQVDGCLGDGDASSGGFPPVCTGAKGGGPGFEVSWAAPQFDSMSYEVRRAASSMKTGAGFPAGLCNDGSTTCTSGNNDIVNWTSNVYTIVQWHSSNTSSTPPAGTTYIGIRPKFTVASVTGNGVSPIWIGTETPMDMQTGDLVTVAGVGGNTNANASNVAITNQVDQQIWFLYEPVGTDICAMTGNGVNPTVITTCTAHGIANGATVKVNNPSNSGQLPSGNTAAGGVWTATVTDSTHLTIPVTGNGTYNPSPYARVHGPGMLVSVVASSGTCTLNTLTAHNLLAGMKFTLINSRSVALGSQPDTTEVLRTIATVPTSTSLTFTCAGVTDGAYNTDPQPGDANCGGGCFGVAQFTARTNSAFAIAGTGNGSWTSGGTVVSTEPNKNFTEIPFSIPGGAPPVCSITTSSLPGGMVGSAYSQTLATSNCSAPLTWSITSGSLPAGLSLGSSTGIISGTPTTAATSSFTAHVVDNASAVSNANLSIVIAASGPGTGVFPLPSAFRH